MAAINASDTSAPQKQYYTYRLFYSSPLDIVLSTRATAQEINGRKYPVVSTTIIINIVDRSDGKTVRRGVMLSSEDWYRWMITIGELLSKVKSIYVDNRIADMVTEDDFKIVTFRGEVLQMVPLMAKKGDDLIPAVRIIVNDAGNFADFPVIDIKSMYNVLNKIDILTMSMVGSLLGESI